MLEEALCLEEGVSLVQRLGKGDASIDLLLRDSGQFRAERSELCVDLRLHIGLELRNDRLLTHVNDDYWELDDFLAAKRISLIVSARAFEVIDANKFDRCLVKEILLSVVEYPSEVGRGDAAICEALRQHDFVLGDPERNGRVSVHGLDHVNLNDDFARAAHSRDYTVSWQANSHMHVVSRHLVEATLHNHRQWLKICAVNNLIVCERVCDLLEQILVPNSLNSVALHRSYVADTLLFHKLEALLVIGFYNVIDDGLGHFVLRYTLDCEQVIELNVAVLAHHNALILGTMTQDIRHCFAGVNKLPLAHLYLRPGCLYHFLVLNFSLAYLL